MSRVAKPNPAQVAVMQHALGVSGSGVSGKPPGFRNNYTATNGDIMLESIVKKGWMVKRNILNDGRDAYYSVTRAGAEAIGLDPSVIRTKEPSNA